MSRSNGVPKKIRPTRTQLNLLSLQKRIHNALRAEVRSLLGRQPQSITRYYNVYKNEFFGPSQSLSMTQFFQNVMSSQLIFVGDYHADATSQRFALQLLTRLRSANPDQSMCLGIEFVYAEHQSKLDDYVSGAITIDQLRRHIVVEQGWSFQFESYQALLEYARDHNIALLALNSKASSLQVRDRNAAQVIKRYYAQVSSSKNLQMVVLFGDLHVAAKHLPLLVARALRSKMVATPTIVFQNSESLYWRNFAHYSQNHGQHCEELRDVVCGGVTFRRFCIMSIAPWMKLKNYLEWLSRTTASGDGDTTDDEGGFDNSAFLHDRLFDLFDAIGFGNTEYKNIDFNIYKDFDNIDYVVQQLATHPSGDDIKQQNIENALSRNISFYEPTQHALVISSTAKGSFGEGLGQIVLATLAGQSWLELDAKQAFWSATMLHALSTCLSLILNPKRRVYTIEDHWRWSKHRLSKRSLPDERLQKRISTLIFSAIQNGRMFSSNTIARLPYETSSELSRRLGGILGQTLYLRFVAEQTSHEELKKLLQKKWSQSPRVAYQTTKQLLMATLGLERGEPRNANQLESNGAIAPNNMGQRRKAA